jgi:hypothetical protein
MEEKKVHVRHKIVSFMSTDNQPVCFGHLGFFISCLRKSKTSQMEWSSQIKPTYSLGGGEGKSFRFAKYSHILSVILLLNFMINAEL